MRAPNLEGSTDVGIACLTGEEGSDEDDATAFRSRSAANRGGAVRLPSIRALIGDVELR